MKPIQFGVGVLQCNDGAGPFSLLDNNLRQAGLPLGLREILSSSIKPMKFEPISKKGRLDSPTKPFRGGELYDRSSALFSPGLGSVTTKMASGM
jgi:hypothetical protein